MYLHRIVRKLLGALVLMILMLGLPSLVFAGGWVVITLDHLPPQIPVGQTYKLGMMARQHGQTPWKVDGLRVEAKQLNTGQSVTFVAKPDQPPGHYTVELLFPQPGQWKWGIQSGLYPTVQPMPVIEVVASAPATSAAALIPPFRPNFVVGLTGTLSVIAVAAGILLLARYRAQKLLRYTGFGLILLAGVSMFALILSINAQARKVVPVTAGSIAAGAELGQQLFIAKGCVVCHVNTRALENAETYSVNIGPNLSAYRNDPEYLSQFLANPKGPATATFKMPNLGLSATEIDALVHFLNEGSVK